MIRFEYAFVAALIGFSAGCRSDGPPAPEDAVEVRGKVLLPSGSPVTGGTLVLRPEGGAHGASALIQSDGGFTASDPSGRAGVVPGKYQVYVALNDASDRTLRAAVNKRYWSSEDGDSDVTVDIAGPNPNLVIRLRK